MDSGTYKGWHPTENIVSNRLKDKSLVHTFSANRKIRASTRLTNKKIRSSTGIKTYSQYVNCKKAILNKIKENVDVTDKSECSDDEYQKFYSSFDISQGNNSAIPTKDDDGFLWHPIEKRGRKIMEPQDHDESYSWEPHVDVKVIENQNKSDLDDQIKATPKKVSQKLNRTITKQTKLKISHSSSAHPTNKLNNYDTNDDISSNKQYKEKSCSLSSSTPSYNNNSISNIVKNNDVVNSAVKKNSVKKQEKVTKDKSPRKIKHEDDSEHVKRNLTTLINSVGSKTPQLSEDEWYSEFNSSDFRAQSTKIFSDTISETNQGKNKNISSNHRLLQKDLINQPRDSGIEEDSREDNAKCEKISNHKKRDEDMENAETRSYTEVNDKENSHVFSKFESKKDNEKSEANKVEHKKPYLKIIGEETITKKYKIISNRDTKLKPITEEKQVLKSENSNKNQNDNLINRKQSRESSSDAEYLSTQDVETTEYDKPENAENDDEYYDVAGENENASEDEENSNDCQKNAYLKKNTNSIKAKDTNSSLLKKDKIVNKGERKDTELEKNDVLSSSEYSSEIETQKELTNIVDRFKKERSTNSKTIEKTDDSESEDDLVPSTRKHVQQLKGLNLLGNDDLKNSENDNTSEENNKVTDKQNNNKSMRNIDEKKNKTIEHIEKESIQSEQENEENESRDKKQRKKALKRQFKRCKSPYMRQKYEELKQLRLVSDSTESSDTDIDKHDKKLKEIEKKSSCGVKLSGSDKLAMENISSVKNKSHEYDGLENDSELNESCTKTNLDTEDISLRSKKHLQQMKRLNLFNNDEDSDSNDKQNISKFEEKISNKQQLSLKKENLVSSRKNSTETETHFDLRPLIDIHKESQSEKSMDSEKNDSEIEDNLLPSNQKQLQQLKRLNLLCNDDSEESETDDIDKQNNKIVDKQNNEKYVKNIDEMSSDEELTETKDHIETKYVESEKKNTSLQEIKKLVSSDSKSDDSKESDKDIENYNSDIDIKEHKISIPEDFQESQITTQNTINNSELNSSKTLKRDSTEKESSADKESTEGSVEINVAHCNSEKEISSDQRVERAVTDSSESGNDSDADVDILCPEMSKRLNMLKRLNLFAESDEDSQEEESKILTQQDADKNIAINSTLQNVCNRNITSSDNESDKSLSPSASQKLSQYKKLNLIDNDSSSSSEDEDKKVINKVLVNSVVKEIYMLQEQINNSKLEKSEEHKLADKSVQQEIGEDKLNSSRLSTVEDLKDFQKDGTENDENIEKIVDIREDASKNEKNIIINETQESNESQNLESQEMFSSLEDLTTGTDQNQVNIIKEPELNNDTERIHESSSTVQAEEIKEEKITKISQLLKKENLSECFYETTTTSNDISDNEELFILEIPKSVFTKNLVGEKLSFSKTTLQLADNEYEAFQRKVSPILSCIFKSNENVKNPFKIINIRPVTSVVARRKKDFNDSNDKFNNKKLKKNKECATSSRSPEDECANPKSSNKSPKNLQKNQESKKQKSPIKEKALDTSIVIKPESEVSKKIKLGNKKENKFLIDNFISKEYKNSLKSLNEKKSLKRKSSDTSDDDLRSNPRLAKSSSNESINQDLVKDANKSKIKKVDTKTNKKLNLSLKIKSKSKKLEDHEMKSETKNELKVKKKEKILKQDIDESELEWGSNFFQLSPAKQRKPRKKAASKPKEPKSQSKENPELNTKAVSKRKRKADSDKNTQNDKNIKKKKKNEDTEVKVSASQEIMNIIGKSIKFNKEKLNTSNSSIESTKYKSLDIMREVGKTKKYCPSSSSSDDESKKKFMRRSFKVRDKTTPGNETVEKPTTSFGFTVSSTSSFNETDLNTKIKKKKSKIFFNE